MYKKKSLASLDEERKMKGTYGDKLYTHHFDQIPQKYFSIFLESQKYVDVGSIKASISLLKILTKEL